MRQKYGGRKAGTPNKTTKEQREMITSIVQKQLENIESDLNSLPAHLRIEMIIKLLKYCLPIASNNTFETDNKIEFVFTKNKTIL